MKGGGPALESGIATLRILGKDEGRNGESSRKHARAGDDAEVRGRLEQPEGIDKGAREGAVNAIMDAEADQLCAGGANSRNGYRERNLVTCVGDITLRIPKLRSGSFFPEDAVERYQRVDRAVVSAVAEMCATGTSTRKVQRVAEKLGISRLSKDQVSAIARNLDADVAEPLGRDLGESRTLYLWLDATYVRCRRSGRVRSTAAVTAIGCDEGGWRHVLGLSVVDTESYDSWLGFLRAIRGRGARGVRLATSDAHKGLVRAIEEVFQGASWRKCGVHLMRDCMREAGSRQLKRRVGLILSPVFRAKDAATARAMCHVACDMLRECCPKAAAAAEEAEPDVLAYLAFPPSHWKRLRTNNVQERANREIKRRSRVVQVLPSEKSLERLVAAVMCEQDETWSESRYFAQEKIQEPYDEKRTMAPAAPETPAAELAAEARKMILAGLELAERVEAA